MSMTAVMAVNLKSESEGAKVLMSVAKEMISGGSEPPSTTTQTD